MRPGTFLCETLRCSFSRSCARCVRLLQASNEESELCQPNTSSINVINGVIRMNLLLSSHSILSSLRHPHTANPCVHTYTHPPTHTQTKTNYNSLSLSPEHTHTQQNLFSTSYQICQPAAPVRRWHTKRLKTCCQKEKWRRKWDTHTHTARRQRRGKDRKKYEPMVPGVPGK